MQHIVHHLAGLSPAVRDCYAGQPVLLVRSAVAVVGKSGTGNCVKQCRHSAGCAITCVQLVNVQPPEVEPWRLAVSLGMQDIIGRVCLGRILQPVHVS